MSCPHHHYSPHPLCPLCLDVYNKQESAHWYVREQYAQPVDLRAGFVMPEQAKKKIPKKKLLLLLR